MLAAFYERQGAARDVLRVEELRTPEPMAGEVRVRMRTSGVNPSDVKSRSGSTGRAMPFPHIIPHSDGAGEIDAVGPGVPAKRMGERVWLWNAQWKRAWGTAAQYVTIPNEQAVRLHEGVDWAEGACLGIPAMTAWQAVHLARPAPGSHPADHGGRGGGRPLRRADRPRPWCPGHRHGRQRSQGRPCPRRGGRLRHRAVHGERRTARVRPHPGFRRGCGRGGGRRRQRPAAARRAAPTRHNRRVRHGPAGGDDPRDSISGRMRSRR